MTIFNSYVTNYQSFLFAFLDMFMGGRASSLLPGRGRHGFDWLGILQHFDSGRLGHWIGIFWRIGTSRIYQMKIRGYLRSMNIWGLKDVLNVLVIHITQLGAVVSNRYEGDVKQIPKKGHLLTSVLDIWENSCTISFGMGLKWLKHETSQHFPAMFVSMLLRTWRCQCDNGVLWMLPSFSEQGVHDAWCNRIICIPPCTETMNVLDDTPLNSAEFGRQGCRSAFWIGSCTFEQFVSSMSF